jgi:ATP-dependent DNA ligase
MLSRPRSRPFSNFIEPCLPRPADKPPAGRDWIHEIKHDIVSKRLGSPYRSGRADCWLKVKNPAAPAVTREAEEEWN